MKRRNVDVSKLRRPLVRRGRMSEDIYGSAFTYIKFFSVWMFVLMADFVLDFRFEYLWPLWLLARSVCDSMKYQGLAFSIFFVCVTITSDVACYLLIPVQWLFFTASTYVWVQYIWQTERGVCLPTVLLWLMFLYIEVAVRLRELRNFPFHLDLCRPFAAHCVGYPVVTMGFSIKSCISYRFRLRKQKEVEKANNFYYQLLQKALPCDEDATNDKPKALPSQDEPVLNGSTAVQSSSLSSTTRSRTLGWLDISLWTGSRDKQSASDSVEDFEFLEQQPTSASSLMSGRMDDRPDDTSSEEGGTLAVGAGDDSRNSAKSGTGVRANSTTRDPLSGGKRGKIGSSSSWQERSSTAAGSRLEADVKRLKSELQSSRCLEQELRSQIASLSFSDRTTKSELYQLRQENENLQSKLQKLVSNRQQDKQNLAILDRRVQEERKQKMTLEQQLMAEKRRKTDSDASRKADDSSRAAVTAVASSSRLSVECSADQCKQRRSELETEVKMLRRELKARDEDVRQLELETQTLQQYRGDSQTETEVLITTLESMKDKNAHLETSLSAETRLKLDLFSALGDAKRQMEIQQEFGVESLSESDSDIKTELDTGKVQLLRHRDFYGRPILYIAARKHSTCDSDINRLTKFIVYMLEQACDKCSEDIIDSLCIIFDLQDFGTANMDYQFVRNLIWLLSHHYPERLGVCLIINAPTVFYGCWAIIKPWLSPVTTSKVVFADDAKMRQYIHPDMLPDDTPGV